MQRIEPVDDEHFDFDQSFMQPSLEKFPQEELHQATMEESMGTTLVSNGCVDIRGRIADKRTTGGWNAAPFIIGNGIIDTLSFYRQLTSTTMQGEAMPTSNQWPDMVPLWCTGPYSPWHRWYQAMVISIVILVAGLRFYRFQKSMGSPFTRFVQVLWASVRNHLNGVRAAHQTEPSEVNTIESDIKGAQKLPGLVLTTIFSL